MPTSISSPRLARAAAPAALVLAALAGLAGCSKPAPPPEPVRAVRTLVVASDAAGASHEYAAEVRARVESRLGFRVGGKIVRRDAQLSDAVKPGQVLAQLDPQDLRLGQESARAALAAAQASFEQAAADHQRYRELLAQGFIGAAEFERRETTLKSARAALEQARAQAAVQGNQAAYASLAADAAGVVTGIDAEPGQVVAAGAPVLRVARDGPRDVVFSVPEDQLALLRGLEGREGALKVRLWGSAQVLPATLREVAAATDAATRTVLAKADVGRAAVTLGQTATVLLDMPRAQGVIKLPLTALVESGGRSAVWLLDAGSMTVTPQPVQVAGADGNAVVVTSGLTPGQEVVTAGVHVLTAGQKVKRYAPAAVASAAAASASR